MTIFNREKTLEERERALLDLSLALSRESNLQLLLEKIVEDAIRLTGAEGGTLYTVREEKLHFEIVRNERFKLHEMLLEPIPLFIDGKQNVERVIAVAVNEKKMIAFKNIYEESQFSKAFDEQIGYRTKAVLTVPIYNHQKKVIAALQLVNPHDPEFFTEDDIILTESFASMAGAALTNRELITDLRDLLYSLSQVISEAIDENGHEKRVPIIASMLAQAVSREEQGPLAPVHFTKEEMEELRLAAYLHDCGKVGIPQHLLNKKTKLETIFDRIELIRLRVKNPDDLAFIELCNKGLAYDAERIKKIEGLTDEERKLLLIENGTLTSEERKIVEMHVERTYQMLSKLKYPKDLERVPEIAASHHERMDGRGYPRGLKGREIPLRGRILAIADIFEALSAAGRSYKEPWKLSKVLQVMGKMCDDGHLDPDIFEIFLNQKVYLDYAKEFLSPEQNDL